MRRTVFSRRALALGVLICSWALVATACAQPPDILRSYRFVPSQSTVIATGGIGGWSIEHEVRGRFDLATGYLPDIRCDRCLVPYAKFEDVDAWMIPDSPLTYVWDLDKTLNLTGLEGTWNVPNFLHFSGLDGQRQPIELHAVLYDRVIRLIGASNPGCCDMFQYTVDLYAHQIPYADFNYDGLVDDDDYAMLRASFGQAVAPGEGADANDNGVVDAADYTVWRDQFGQSLPEVGVPGLGAGAAIVPEPAALLLILIGAALTTIARRR